MPEPQAPPRIAPAAADTLTALSARHRAAGASRPAEAPVNGAGTVGFGRCLECRVLFGSTAGRHTGVPPAKRWTGALRAILLHVETALHHPAPDNGPLAIEFTRPVQSDFQHQFPCAAQESRTPTNQSHLEPYGLATGGFQSSGGLALDRPRDQGRLAVQLARHSATFQHRESNEPSMSISRPCRNRGRGRSRNTDGSRFGRFRVMTLQGVWPDPVCPGCSRCYRAP